MPKQLHKKIQFHGGFNEGVDKKDLQDNEFAKVVNADLETIGTVRLIGSFPYHESNSMTGMPANTNNPPEGGTGLFTFNTDMQIIDGSSGAFLTDGTSDISNPCNIILMGIAGDVYVFQKIISGGTPRWSATDLDLGGGVNLLLKYYLANGAVRVYDKDGAVPFKWLGPITPKIYGGVTPITSSGTTTYNQYGNNVYFTRQEASVYRTSQASGDSIGGTNQNYQFLNAEIAGAFPTQTIDGYDICKNATMMTTVNGAVWGNIRPQEKGNESTLTYTPASLPSSDTISCGAGDNVFANWEIGYRFTSHGWSNTDFRFTDDAVNVTNITSSGDVIHFANAETSGSDAAESSSSSSVFVRGFSGVQSHHGLAKENSDLGNHDHDNKLSDWLADSGTYWGMGLDYREGVSNSGTWMPTTNTKYKFYITTLYDDGTQESLPQLLAMYSTLGIVPDYSSDTIGYVNDSTGGVAGADYLTDSANDFLRNGFARGQKLDISGFDDDTDNNPGIYDSSTGTWAGLVTVTEVEEGKLYFTGGGSGASDETAESDNIIRVKVEGTDGTDDKWNNANIFERASEHGAQTHAFHLNCSQKFAETEISMCNGDTIHETGQNVRMWFLPKFKINGAQHGTADSAATPTNSNKFVFGNGDNTSTNYGNPRISGCKIYWASNEDGYSTLWEMMDCDFAKGVRAFGLDGISGQSGYAPWRHWSDFPGSGISGTESATTNTAGHYLTPDMHDQYNNRWLHPPKYRTYFENNFHNHDDVITLDTAQSIVIANGRAYAGNVTQTIDGIKQHFPDRILISPPGQYDKFPSQSFLETGINDGDEIIHLASFADRLLRFDKNKLHIINISQDAAYIEDTYKFKGVLNSSSVCTTDRGVSWANQHGVFHYDGREVVDLLEAKGVKKILDTTWSTFAGTPMLGYLPDTKQLVVFDDVGDAKSGNGYMYSFLTKAWVECPALGTDAVKSNFINDYDNTLTYWQWDSAGSELIRGWSGTKVTNSTFNLELKDEDFGEPALRKKLYKIYITYKCSADTNVKAVYATNGGSSFGFDFAAGTNYASNNLQSTSSEWAQAELIPDDKSEANNIYSIQLKLYATGAVPANFEINDITYVYRKKSIK